MKHFSGSTCLALIGISLLVTGCGSINIWPFGESKSQNASRGPENATEYRCDAGKVFHVRSLDAGKSAWVMLPDRQVRLDQVAADGGGRYSNGIAELRVNGVEATLTDGPTVAYSNCKATTAASK